MSSNRPRYGSTGGAAVIVTTIFLALLAPGSFRAQAADPFIQYAPCAVPPDPENDTWPVAVTDFLGPTGSASLTFPSASLLDDDKGFSLVVVRVGPAGSQGGVVTGAGPFTYTAAAGFTGTDIVPYEIRDANGRTAVGIVRVAVTGDTVLPTVSISAPAAGSTVSGSVTVMASANDNIGVAGVRFFDGAAPIGNEDTAFPYEASWNTTLVANGNHNLNAVARDAAGNTETSAVVGVTVSNVVVPPPPPGGAVLALSFNEAAGTTAIDESAYANNGTIAGASRVAGQAGYGSALSFDGSNDWVTVADSASLDLTNGMTIEAWVKPSAINGWETVVLKERGAGNMAYALYAADGTVALGGVDGPAAYANIGSVHRAVRQAGGLPLGTWTHVATTYDGASQRLYVNGALAASRAQTGTMAVSANALRIGGNAAWAGEFFAGLIDDVRVYNRALSAGEIATDMSTPLTGGVPPAPSVMVAVPTLATLTQTAAQNAITGAGLSVGTISSAYSPSVPLGQVMSQNPAATTSVAVGSAVSFTLSLGPEPPAPPAAGPVLALSFNDAGGTVTNDSSGHGNHGTVAGALVAASRAGFGSALSFDGVNDWVTVGDSATLDLTNGLTIEAWVRPSVVSGWETVVMKERGVGNLAYALYSADGTVAQGGADGPAGYANIGNVHRSVRQAAALPLGAWTHIATTYDGANQRIYVNGALVASRGQTGNVSVTASPLRIGGNAAWAGEFFQGLIDEVRVYNRALGATEIATDMNTPIP
jgi:hypothetical protein